MNKQWSLWVKWSDNHNGTVRAGYVHFLWDGKQGRQIDYTMGLDVQHDYHVRFVNTDTYHGFVKWAIDSAESLPCREYSLMPGCPECGSILNGKAAECLSEWHEENKPSSKALATFMDENLPLAVKMADGDHVLAALNVIHTTQNVVSVTWPILQMQMTAVAQALRAGGIPIPE